MAKHQNELVCDYYVMLGIIKIGHLGAELCRFVQKAAQKQRPLPKG